MKSFKACAYLRLSQADEDKGRDDESNSITNQRALIEEYVNGHTDIKLVEEKVDDGYSGIYFDRPAFQEMIKDIENGRIDCVIVKDLSRFGRNYIESGRYQEYFFSLYNVRFISVNDCIDMKPGEEEDLNLLLPFKNIMNDAFSRDISMKTKSHMDIRRKKGLFLSAFAPYGYQKDPEDKNRLLPDTFASAIVREIYDWKLEGLSTARIAEKLNSLSVLAPSDYKASVGLHYKTPFKVYGKTRWDSAAVNRILTNSIYLGHLAQGKTKKISLKIKSSVPVDPSKWVCVKNTHMPVIAEEKFLMAQRFLSSDFRVRAGKKSVSPLSGFVYCGGCGQPMNHKLVNSNGRRYDYYICSSYQKDRRACSSHLIREKTLEEALLFFLQRHIHMTADKKEIFELIGEKENALLREEMRKKAMHALVLRKRLKRAEGLKASVVRDWKEGLMNKREYQALERLYREQCMELEGALSELALNYKQNINGILEKKRRFDDILRGGCAETLSRGILIWFIDKITVYNHCEIDVNLRFHEAISETLPLQKRNESMCISEGPAGEAKKKL